MVPAVRINCAEDERTLPSRGGLPCILTLTLALVFACFSPVRASETPKSHRGFAYSRETVPEVPWSIHVFRVDRSHKEFELQPALGRGSLLGMSPVPDQVKSWPQEFGRPIAAINGDFYRGSSSSPGDPEGLMITRGELISGPSETHSCFWIDAQRMPHRGIVLPRFQATLPGHQTFPFGLNEDRPSHAAVLYTERAGGSTRTSGGIDLVLTSADNEAPAPLRPGMTYHMKARQIHERGNATIPPGGWVLSLGPQLLLKLPKFTPEQSLKLSTATLPDLSGARSGLGGGPTLVSNSVPAHLTDGNGRHPRSAVGWNDQSFFLVTVDGRQRQLSAGMTLTELGAYMRRLGCTEALNLDGGGSSVLWVLDNIMNSPSEGRARPCANSLLVIQLSNHPPAEITFGNGKESRP